MRYDLNKEKDKLNQTNEELIKFMRDYPKESISLTAIGNSISDGFSMSEPGKLLLDRNAGLIEFGKSSGVAVDTYHLARSENNNSLTVADWIIQNCTEKDTHDWNKADYERHIVQGKQLLDEKEIDKFFSGGSEIKVQDVIFDKRPSNANIVILNLGTGSFLDVITRNGSLTIPGVLGTIDREILGISAILELIQNNNRKNGSKTQVYLCGAPRVMNSALTDIFMNPKIKNIAVMFANVTYVPSFPRQPFYRSTTGNIIPDPHYNQAEYYHFLNEVEKKIIDSYFIRDLMIDLDAILTKMSSANDVNNGYYNKDDFKDVVDSIAKKYESKDGNYNYFIDFIKPYIKKRYPFDFYRISEEQNLSNELNKMKRGK